MRIINRIIITCLVLAFISCDALIEVEAPNNQIASSQVFADRQTAYAALSGLYSSLRVRSIISGNNNGVGSLLGSYADDLDCYYNDQNGFDALWRNQQLATNSAVETFWRTAYQHIYHANAIIHGTENSTTLAEADRNQIMGEALFIRSLHYFYLQRIFGEIPYTTTLDYEANRNIAKTGEDALLGQLEADLIAAIDLLDLQYRDPERIYPNKGASQLLLANIYLLMGRYAEAEQTGYDILQSQQYDFQHDLQEVFHYDSRHILWQLKPQNDGSSTQEASFFYFAAVPQSYALSDDLLSAFEPSDLRMDSWIQEVSNEQGTWYRSAKYKNLSGSNNNEYSVVYRLEEVYMVLAEALAMQGHLDEAAPYLNATRTRAGLTEITPLSKEVFLEELLKEKRREFFTEFGIRFLDLKRLGKLTQLIATKPFWTDTRKVWPYPQNELLLNPNLNLQNDGY